MRTKVWNDNKYDYKEKFKGEEISIPAGGFVEMNRDDAVMFKGSFSPISTDVDGNPHPKSFKRIRLEHIAEKTAEEKVELTAKPFKK